jgi:hypothetical protein
MFILLIYLFAPIISYFHHYDFNLYYYVSYEYYYVTYIPQYDFYY